MEEKPEIYELKISYKQLNGKNSGELEGVNVPQIVLDDLLIQLMNWEKDYDMTVEFAREYFKEEAKLLKKKMHKFNEEKHIASMIPARDKLVAYLFKKHKITFEPADELGKNVVFKKDDKVLKICYQCFYRMSGVAALKKEINEKEVEMVTVTLDMFLEDIMKSIVEWNLVPKEKK